MDLAGRIESVQIAVKNYSGPGASRHFLAFEVVGKTLVPRWLQRPRFRIHFESKVFKELRSQHGKGAFVGRGESYVLQAVSRDYDRVDWSINDATAFQFQLRHQGF